MNTSIHKHPPSTNTSKPQECVAAKAKAPPCKPRLRAKHPGAAPSQPAQVIKLGVDVGLRKYAYCRQVDASLQDPPRMTTPEQFREFALAQKSLARRVVMCYEAGCFGFELARWAQAHGIDCWVMAPVRLDEGHTRVENDKLNARDICGRLDRYLAGNTRAMTVCRVPTRAEELARSQTRLRQQLVNQRKALQAQGRSLLWQFGYLAEGQQPWWKLTVWGELQGKVDATVAANLARLRAVLESVEQQLKELMAQLRPQAEAEVPRWIPQLPAGVGWLSMLILTREIMDWHRFNNRRQVGCLTGLVPSEASTGESRRQGSITKVGNPIVRLLLIEMVWRLVRFQPECHAIRRWLPVLQDRRQGAAARKRAAVAAARVLAIDLWRLATGQTTLATLGFRV